MVSVAILMGIFKRIESIGKNSRVLSQAFTAMKEASGTMQVYNTAMEMLNQQITIASMDAIKVFVELLSDPELQPLIDALGVALKAFATLIKWIWDSIKTAEGRMSQMDAEGKEAERTLTNIKNLILDIPGTLTPPTIPRDDDADGYIFH